jgi:hypothetical protein
MPSQLDYLEQQITRTYGAKVEVCRFGRSLVVARPGLDKLASCVVRDGELVVRNADNVITLVTDFPFMAAGELLDHVDRESMRYGL